MFRKITTSLSYNSISAFVISLQIFFCSVSCQYFYNLMSVKVLMISCLQTFKRFKRLNFITNNVKECNRIKTDQKLIQYFKENIGLTGVLFLQENHSSSKVEQKRKKDFNGQVFFSHGKNKFLWCPNCLVWKRNF